MGSLVPVHPVAVTIGFHVIRESYVCSLAWHGTDAEASIFREPSAFARIMTRSNSAKEPKSVGFGACDSPLEEGVSCELVSGNPDFNVRKKRTGVQKPSLISILIRFNDY